MARMRGKRLKGRPLRRYALFVALAGLFGILLLFGRVIRLFPEITWVNSFRVGDPGLDTRSPVLLAPMATLLGNKVGEMALTPMTARCAKLIA